MTEGAETAARHDGAQCRAADPECQFGFCRALEDPGVRLPFSHVPVRRRARHSFASIANDLGFTEVTIAALVGHAKGSVTSKYIHTSDAALIMAADTISGYIQGYSMGSSSS